MRRTLFAFVAVCTLLVSPTVNAQGESLTDAQLDAIRANCVNAQIVMQQLQQSEKPTRINRGYLYESTLKLMVNFNSRAALNRVDAPELLSITSDYEKNLREFSTIYTEYDDSISEILSTDCRQQPTTFHNQLLTTREKRSQLNTRVKELDSLLDRYETEVTAIAKGMEGSK